jgi:hypothetical protein
LITGKEIPANKLAEIGTREEHEESKRNIMGLSLLDDLVA